MRLTFSATVTALYRRSGTREKHHFDLIKKYLLISDLL